jgi:hypothetical protein
VPNGHDGVLITSTGGDNLVRTNVMSGNRGNGIELAGNASGVTVDPDIAGLTTKGTHCRTPGVRCGTWAVITTSCATGCESSHPVTGHRGETAPSRLGHAKWVGNSPK